MYLRPFISAQVKNKRWYPMGVLPPPMAFLALSGSFTDNFVMTVLAPTILRIDGSTRHRGSVSRELSDLAVTTLQDHFGVAHVTQRDTRNGIGNISSAWRTASLTPNEARSSEDRAVLAQSEALVTEVSEADLLLLAVPIYNFSIPAALKSWIDLICRDNVDGGRANNLARQYKNKQALIILTSNYTRANGDGDFATPYLKFILQFIGIDSVAFIDATGFGNDQAGVLARAQDAVKSQCMRIADTWNKQTAAE